MSSLTPITLGVAVGEAASAAESRKHAANDAKCQELEWSCILLAIETYDNWRERGSRLASLLAISQASPKSKMIDGHLNFILSEISG